MQNFKIPEVLPVSPINIACPLCKSKPGKDCATRFGGLSVIHVARVKAAALQDATNKRKRDQAAARMVK